MKKRRPWQWKLRVAAPQWHSWRVTCVGGCNLRTVFVSGICCPSTTATVRVPLAFFFSFFLFFLFSSSFLSFFVSFFLEDAFARKAAVGAPASHFSPSLRAEKGRKRPRENSRLNPRQLYVVTRKRNGACDPAGFYRYGRLCLRQVLPQPNKEFCGLPDPPIVPFLPMIGCTFLDQDRKFWFYLR